MSSNDSLGNILNFDPFSASSSRRKYSSLDINVESACISIIAFFPLDFSFRLQRYKKILKNANNWWENLQMSKKMYIFVADLFTD